MMISRPVLTLFLLLISFVAINVASSQWLDTAQIDATEDGLFTISAPTRAVLADLPEPVTLRYYRAAALDDLGGPLARHARRIDGLMAQLARISDGRLRLQKLDPQPYSPQEDQAVLDGVAAVPIGPGSAAYLGAAAVNSTDDVAAISFLDPARGDFLEYDLISLIAAVAQPGKPVVGLLGDLPLAGDARRNFQPSALMTALEESFEIRRVFNGAEQLDADIDALLIAQPEALAPSTLFAIDQFVLAGGATVVAADPVAETFIRQSQSPMLPGSPAGAAPSTLDPLFSAWGIEIPSDWIVADQDLAQRAQAQIDGRMEVIDYVPWMALTPAQMNVDEPVFAGLTSLNVTVSGVVRAAPDADPALIPLLTVPASSSGLMPAAIFRSMPDPKKVLSAFSPDEDAHMLAGRLTGELVSAFPDGPPATVTADPDASYLAQSITAANVVVLADADMLMDATWVQSMRSVTGGVVPVPFANNGDFFLNLMDQMVGQTGLSGLRGRAVRPRPFTVLDDLNAQAEARYRESEQALLTRLEQTEQRLSDLRSTDSAAQQAEMDRFTADLLDIRQNLRAVQFGLRREAEALKSRIIVANVLLVPVLVALAAAGLGFVRRRRARQSVGGAS